VKKNARKHGRVFTHVTKKAVIFICTLIFKKLYI